MPFAVNPDFSGGDGSGGIIIPPAPPGSIPVPQPPVFTPVGAIPPAIPGSIAVPEPPSRIVPPSIPSATAAIASPSGGGEVEARGLPQQGVPKEDLGPIVAPHPTEPTTTTAEEPTAPEAPTAEPGALDGFEFSPFYGEGGGLSVEAANAKILRHHAFTQSLQKHCANFDVDGLAMAANAINEGLSGAVGDQGHAFGPWQIWAEDGRLPQFSGLPLYSPMVQGWTWTDNGIEYAVRSAVAGGARGLRGHAAVHAIVYGFELPADKSGAYATRVATYDNLRAKQGTAWDYIASLANGPSLSATPTGGTVGTYDPSGAATEPATPSGAAAAKKKVAASTNLGVPWRGVLHLLARDMPFAANHAQTIAEGLTKVVK